MRGGQSRKSRADAGRKQPDRRDPSDERQVLRPQRMAVRCVSPRGSEMPTLTVDCCQSISVGSGRIQSRSGRTNVPLIFSCVP